MLRNYIYLSFTNFVYVRLKGLIWVFSGLSNHNTINKSAGDSLEDIYKNVEFSKPLIVDCKGISSVTDHSLDKFFKAVDGLKREAVFINFQKIDQQINFNKKEFCSSMKMTNDDMSFSIFYEGSHLIVDNKILSEIDQHIINKISHYIRRSFHHYEKNEFHPLPSTPINSNGEFDAAQIVSKPESFYWTSIRMSDEVERIIQDFRIGSSDSSIRLLTVSLRASPIAGAIGLLLDMKVETVDHFGPIFNNKERDSSTSIYEYIYIGDFTVGGTEIKVSKTYAHMKNCKLQHAVVIGSVFNKEAFKEFSLHPLTYLKKACPAVEYVLSIEN